MYLQKKSYLKTTFTLTVLLRPSTTLWTSQLSLSLSLSLSFPIRSKNFSTQPSPFSYLAYTLAKNSNIWLNPSKHKTRNQTQPLLPYYTKKERWLDAEMERWCETTAAINHYLNQELQLQLPLGCSLDASSLSSSLMDFSLPILLTLTITTSQDPFPRFHFRHSFDLSTVFLNFISHSLLIYKILFSLSILRIFCFGNKVCFFLCLYKLEWLIYHIHPPVRWDILINMLLCLFSPMIQV